MNSFEKYNDCLNRVVYIANLFGVCIFFKTFKYTFMTYVTISVSITFVTLSAYTIFSAWGDITLILQTLAIITNGSQVRK